jgi:hypothetical protein
VEADRLQTNASKCCLDAGSTNLWHLIQCSIPV